MLAWYWIAFYICGWKVEGGNEWMDYKFMGMNLIDKLSYFD